MYIQKDENISLKDSFICDIDGKVNFYAGINSYISDIESDIEDIESLADDFSDFFVFLNRNNCEISDENIINRSINIISKIILNFRTFFQEIATNTNTFLDNTSMKDSHLHFRIFLNTMNVLKYLSNTIKDVYIYFIKFDLACFVISLINKDTKSNILEIVNYICENLTNCYIRRKNDCFEGYFKNMFTNYILIISDIKSFINNDLKDSIFENISRLLGVLNVDKDEQLQCYDIICKLVSYYANIECYYEVSGLVRFIHLFIKKYPSYMNNMMSDKLTSCIVAFINPRDSKLSKECLKLLTCYFDSTEFINEFIEQSLVEKILDLLQCLNDSNTRLYLKCLSLLVTNSDIANLRLYKLGFLSRPQLYNFARNSIPFSYYTYLITIIYNQLKRSYFPNSRKILNDMSLFLIHCCKNEGDKLDLRILLECCAYIYSVFDMILAYLSGIIEYLEEKISKNDDERFSQDVIKMINRLRDSG